MSSFEEFFKKNIGDDDEAKKILDKLSSYVKVTDAMFIDEEDLKGFNDFLVQKIKIWKKFVTVRTVEESAVSVLSIEEMVHILEASNKGTVEEEDDGTKLVRTYWSLWRIYSKNSVLKRKREDGDEPQNPSKKQALQNDAEVSSSMEILPPKENHKWYLSRGNDNLFLRPCVRDLALRIVDHLPKAKEKAVPTVFVVSGASGIGKSWSINVFMAELLREGMKIFFHSGSIGRAWKIDKQGVTPAAPGDIWALSKEWIYVYDSPGSRSERGSVVWQAFERFQEGNVSLIFSSPKRQNYALAYDKTSGNRRIFNLPTWNMEDMVKARGEANRKAISASYHVWGGNMRALDRFLDRSVEEGLELATLRSEKEIEAGVNRISKELAKRMTEGLEKQEVENALNGAEVQDCPGNILTPEPMVTNASSKDCFDDFQWRFCSALAEKAFFKRAKKLDHELLKDLLVKVFQEPSSKGVLFEKVSHLLINNGNIHSFKCYPYNDKQKKSEMNLPPCNKIVNFANENLEDELRSALNMLLNETGAVALEPLDTSFDAVDMFVVTRKAMTGCASDFSFYLLQDTIGKKHSFRPIKVLHYCIMFCRVYREIFSSSNENPMDCCKYVPIVPNDAKSSFVFEKATSTLQWNELDRVREFLNFDWPQEFQRELNAAQPNWESVAKCFHLEIAKTARGGKRVLNQSVVGNALLLKRSEASNKVKEMCQVIYDVII